jgi:hypothetical protein
MIDKQDSSDDDGDSSDEEETPSKVWACSRLATPIMDSKAGRKLFLLICFPP